MYMYHFYGSFAYWDKWCKNREPLQYLDTVSWVTGWASGLQKILNQQSQSWFLFERSVGVLFHFNES